MRAFVMFKEKMLRSFTHAGISPASMPMNESIHRTTDMCTLHTGYSQTRRVQRCVCGGDDKMCNVRFRHTVAEHTQHKTGYRL